LFWFGLNSIWELKCAGCDAPECQSQDHATAWMMNSKTAGHDKSPGHFSSERLRF
jgi:hypothetical protein